ncbi:hypothetical protein M427DRAFT_108497 [Gonapodya prolifera JEL478]|uniref:P-loop containing nucleoside triphosphate hydrolase protein n=1 Tax=Gonapodya prolifera (strain JEL478) TaxID=1344416 RepID=A0A139ASE4_GONPJ|nr:hypothetical protein M427DRAFT_108497 [Gonapodya prolifera JEL478]|eukprot:KXS19662.1 hypothetical protein M427DRAFT_108497 [Gonapodya prolifera JEL478]
MALNGTQFSSADMAQLQAQLTASSGLSPFNTMAQAPTLSMDALTSSNPGSQYTQQYHQHLIGNTMSSASSPSLPSSVSSAHLQSMQLQLQLSQNIAAVNSQMNQQALQHQQQFPMQNTHPSLQQGQGWNGSSSAADLGQNSSLANRGLPSMQQQVSLAQHQQTKQLGLHGMIGGGAAYPGMSQPALTPLPRQYPQAEIPYGHHRQLPYSQPHPSYATPAYSTPYQSAGYPPQQYQPTPQQNPYARGIQQLQQPTPAQMYRGTNYAAGGVVMNRQQRAPPTYQQPQHRYTQQYAPPPQQRYAPSMGAGLGMGGGVGLGSGLGGGSYSGYTGDAWYGSQEKVPQKVSERNHALKADTNAHARFRYTWLYHHRGLFAPFLNPNHPPHAPYEPQNLLTTLPQKLPHVLSSQPLPCGPRETQPESVVNGEMKDYQLKGLGWLTGMFDNGINAILGDEMGLGKTLQTLAFLAVLKNEKKLSGPYLIVCPLSVLEGWVRECRKWTPSLKLLRFHGVQKERDRLKQILHDDPDIDVIVTTYEMAVSEMFWFRQRVYRVVVMDEGHRIKNEQTQLATAVFHIHSQYRLLLTGTPLQNNLKELWSLLHWLLPEVFQTYTADVFVRAFDLSQNLYDARIVDASRRLLDKLMLRRLKTHVNLNIPPKEEVTIYLPLSPFQRFWYKRLITQLDQTTIREIFNVRGQGTLVPRRDASDEQIVAAFKLDEVENRLGERSSDKATPNEWKKLMNLVMQLRKCCNHPFLFPNSEPEPYENTEQLVLASSKFILLDKLLPKLQSEGHRVLIFSGFTRMMDILEDYLLLRQTRFLRLDGQTSRARRNLDIKLFNAPNSEYLVFLLATRAGGLGINLTGADTVIFFDSDWNPQVDIQAQARAHRIGQTKPVTVYRLVCKETVEERILHRTLRKLYLSLRVTEETDDATNAEPKFSARDLIAMIRMGSSSLASSDSNEEALGLLNAPIDVILENSKRHMLAVQDAEREGRDLEEELFQLKAENVSTRIFDGEYIPKSNKEIAQQWQELTKRARSERVVTIDGEPVLKETLGVGDEAVATIVKKKNIKPEPKKGPKKPTWEHDSECFYCRDGGDVYLCSRCPRVYHFDCLEEDDRKMYNNFFCPQHHCEVCRRNTSDAGGLLFRCSTCPVAYCEDCLPEHEIEPVGVTNPDLVKKGYGYLAQAYFIRCKVCCDFYAALERGEEPPAYVKPESEPKKSAKKRPIEEDSDEDDDEPAAKREKPGEDDDDYEPDQGEDAGGLDRLKHPKTEKFSKVNGITPSESMLGTTPYTSSTPRLPPTLAERSLEPKANTTSLHTVKVKSETPTLMNSPESLPTPTSVTAPPPPDLFASGSSEGNFASSISSKDFVDTPQSFDEGSMPGGEMLDMLSFDESDKDGRDNIELGDHQLGSVFDDRGSLSTLH